MEFTNILDNEAMFLKRSPTTVLNHFFSVDNFPISKTPSVEWSCEKIIFTSDFHFNSNQSVT